jgi:hypothetical protein
MNETCNLRCEGRSKESQECATMSSVLVSQRIASRNGTDLALSDDRRPSLTRKDASRRTLAEGIALELSEGALFLRPLPPGTDVRAFARIAAPGDRPKIFARRRFAPYPGGVGGPRFEPIYLLSRMRSPGIGGRELQNEAPLSSIRAQNRDAQRFSADCRAPRSGKKGTTRFGREGA